MRTGFLDFCHDLSFALSCDVDWSSTDQKFNNALCVTEVVLLLKLFNLVESILESLVSEVASSLVALHDFVVEDREVKGKTELDGVQR